MYVFIFTVGHSVSRISTVLPHALAPPAPALLELEFLFPALKMFAWFTLLIGNKRKKIIIVFNNKLLLRLE